MTALLALLGHPVAHSRSPAMMAAALRALGADAVYVARDVPPARLGDAVRGLRALGFAGANVTLPHKVAVLPLLDAVDPLARAVGAVNAVAREGDALVGYNTDADGVAAALADAGVAVRGADAVVLGAGGAARAAVAGLARSGARSVVVLARRAEAAVAVAGVARAVAAGCARAGHAMPSPDAAAALARAAIVVQATPCGMDHGPPARDVLAAADLRACAPGAAAMDLVYAPRETEWLRAATALGLRPVDGVGMLVHQGAAALRLWLGPAMPGAAPVAAMRAAVDA